MQVQLTRWIRNPESVATASGSPDFTTEAEFGRGALDEDAGKRLAAEELVDVTGGIGAAAFDF